MFDHMMQRDSYLFVTFQTLIHGQKKQHTSRLCRIQIGVIGDLNHVSLLETKLSDIKNKIKIELSAPIAVSLDILFDSFLTSPEII